MTSRVIQGILVHFLACFYHAEACPQERSSHITQDCNFTDVLPNQVPKAGESLTYRLGYVAPCNVDESEEILQGFAYWENFALASNTGLTVGEGIVRLEIYEEACTDHAAYICDEIVQNTAKLLAKQVDSVIHLPHCPDREVELFANYASTGVLVLSSSTLSVPSSSFPLLLTPISSYGLLHSVLQEAKFRQAVRAGVVSSGTFEHAALARDVEELYFNSPEAELDLTYSGSFVQNEGALDVDNVDLVLQNMQSAAVQIVIFVVSKPQSIVIIERIAKLEIDFDSVNFYEDSAEELASSFAGQESSFVTTSAFWSPSWDSECEVFGSNADFVAGFQSWSGGRVPSEKVALGATLGVTLQHALQHAGVVHNLSIRRALVNRHPAIPSLWGPLLFKDNGANQGRPPLIKQIQESGVHVVAPPELATAPLVLPVPSWQCRLAFSEDADVAVGCHVSDQLHRRCVQDYPAVFFNASLCSPENGGDVTKYRDLFYGMLTLSAFLVLVLVGRNLFQWLGITRKKTKSPVSGQAGSVWLHPEDVEAMDPMQVVGLGTFGDVFMATFRGSKVAVKTIVPHNFRDLMKMPPTPECSLATDHADSFVISKKFRGSSHLIERRLTRTSSTGDLFTNHYEVASRSGSDSTRSHHAAGSQDSTQSLSHDQENPGCRSFSIPGGHEQSNRSSTLSQLSTGKPFRASRLRVSSTDQILQSEQRRQTWNEPYSPLKAEFPTSSEAAEDLRTMLRSNRRATLNFPASERELRTQDRDSDSKDSSLIPKRKQRNSHHGTGKQDRTQSLSHAQENRDRRPVSVPGGHGKTKRSSTLSQSSNKSGKPFKASRLRVSSTDQILQSDQRRQTWTEPYSSAKAETPTSSEAAEDLRTMLRSNRRSTLNFPASERELHIQDRDSDSTDSSLIPSISQRELEICPETEDMPSPLQFNRRATVKLPCSIPEDGSGSNVHFTRRATIDFPPSRMETHDLDRSSTRKRSWSSGETLPRSPKLPTSPSSPTILESSSGLFLQFPVAGELEKLPESHPVPFPTPSQEEEEEEEEEGKTSQKSSSQTSTGPDEVSLTIEGSDETHSRFRFKESVPELSDDEREWVAAGLSEIKTAPRYATQSESDGDTSTVDAGQTPHTPHTPSTDDNSPVHAFRFQQRVLKRKNSMNWKALSKMEGIIAAEAMKRDHRKNSDTTMDASAFVSKFPRPDLSRKASLQERQTAPLWDSLVNEHSIDLEFEPKRKSRESSQLLRRIKLQSFTDHSQQIIGKISQSLGSLSVRIASIRTSGGSLSGASYSSRYVDSSANSRDSTMYTDHPSTKLQPRTPSGFRISHHRISRSCRQSHAASNKYADSDKSKHAEEIQQLVSIRHPHIVPLLGAYVDENYGCCMVMEFMEYGSLYDVLQHQVVPLDLVTCINMLVQIADGILHLHETNPPIIHGNIKSANILLGHNMTAKVADLGMTMKSVYRGGCGSPFWMAPECMPGAAGDSRKVDDKTVEADVYAFGMTMWEIFSREDPYSNLLNINVAPEKILHYVKSTNLRPAIPEGLPDAISSLILQCWESNPSQRPSMRKARVTLLEELECQVKEQKRVKKFKRRRYRQRSMSRNLELLHQMLPPKVAAALTRGEKVQPESFEIVTVFFSDIVGYTDLSATLAPEQVMSMLDRLYTKLDILCKDAQLFKVETIGDAYMCVGGLPEPQADHTARVAVFALGAVKIANSILVDEFNPELGYINIRAGFHSGPVVASVVGELNPRYCLFGDTVNTASRMESNSLANMINMSPQAHECLKMQAPFIHTHSRGTIHIKGKGHMECFFLDSTQDNEDVLALQEF